MWEPLYIPCEPHEDEDPDLCLLKPSNAQRKKRHLPASPSSLGHL